MSSATTGVTGPIDDVRSAAVTGWRARRGDAVSLLVLAAALAAFPLVASTTLLNAGVYALIYSIAAIGLSLLMGLAGQVSLGHAGFFAIGAYTQAILVTRYGTHLLLALLAAVALTLVSAFLVGLFLLRLRGHYLALATLGFGIMVFVVARESEYTGATSGIFGIPKPLINGRTYDSPAEFFWLAAPVVLIGLLLARNLVTSRLGRALSAVNDSEVAAEALGVNTFRMRLQVFVVSAGYAAVAGALFAHWLTVVSPDSANFPLSVTFLLMAVLGGLGTVWGAVIGAFAVQGLGEILRNLIPRIVPDVTGEVQLLGFGIVLAALVVFLPGGLYELWRRALRALRPRRQTSMAALSAASAAKDGGEPPVDIPTLRAAAIEEALAVDRRVSGRGPLLLARGISARFGGVVAVDDVDLTVSPGEILALIGPNGAGKTTLFNIISGVISPLSGTVTVRGRRVDGRPPHVFASAHAARTFQTPQMFASMTVLGNVMVGAHLRGHAGLLAGGLAVPAIRGERALERHARRLIDLVGMTKDTDTPVQDLPFGRQRLVEITRALAAGPDLLLLDEPMAGLAGPERRALSDLLRQLRAAGLAVVLVEHDVEAVLALADRVAVLEEGSLIALDVPGRVRQDPAVIAAYLGTDDDDDEVAAALQSDAADSPQRMPGE